MVTVSTTLPPCKDKTRFDFVPTQTNLHLGPNCIVYPLDYAFIKGGLQRGLQILINLGQQGCKITTGSSIRALPEGPIRRNYDNTGRYLWSEYRGTLGTWRSGGGSS